MVEDLMRTGSKKFLQVALIAMLIVSISAREGFGIWRSMLVEYFDKNQQVRPVQQWPWQTPLQNVNQRWHYNPWAPYYRYEPVRTDFTWGVQNFIYNSYIRQREEFPASIWCAWTNRNDVDHPRWPEDDLYEHNQNAWTWWGPFNLRNAVNAGVSFWYYVDVQYGMRDSLCVVVSNTNQTMTTNGNAFRTGNAFGTFVDDSGRVSLTKFPHDSQDWQRREFFLDSLRKLDANGRIIDTVSYLGEGACWLAFVWQSNDRAIDQRNGRGAFIDDVQVMWDDGLFEIQPDLMEYGYPVDEENIDWNTDYPQNNDKVRFRLKWLANGLGECGPFTITCSLDGRRIFSEERTVIARADTSFISEVDTLWEVTAGDHILRWELDTPIADGGRVEESLENNNFIEQTFSVTWNPPPQFEILTPEFDSTAVSVNERYPIEFALSDSNETDQNFTVYLFWTTDTSGLAEDKTKIYDYHYITNSFNVERDDTQLIWDLARSFETAEIDTDMVVYICGYAADGFLNNQTNSVATGRVWTRPPLSAPKDAKPVRPASFGLNRTYPNPFNKSIMIDYSTLTAGKVNLSVYDLTGRKVQTLINGNSGPGSHIVNWSPDGIGAGVYLIRLEAGGNTSLQKAIYTP